MAAAFRILDLRLQNTLGRIVQGKAWSISTCNKDVDVWVLSTHGLWPRTRPRNVSGCAMVSQRDLPVTNSNACAWRNQVCVLMMGDIDLALGGALIFRSWRYPYKLIEPFNKNIIQMVITKPATACRDGYRQDRSSFILETIRQMIALSWLFMVDSKGENLHGWNDVDIDIAFAEDTNAKKRLIVCQLQNWSAWSRLTLLSSCLFLNGSLLYGTSNPSLESFLKRKTKLLMTFLWLSWSRHCDSKSRISPWSRAWPRSNRHGLSTLVPLHGIIEFLWME